MVRSFRSLGRLLLWYRVAAAQARRLIGRTAKSDEAVNPEEERTDLPRPGMSAEEIAQESYKRDLQAGGWLFDMGLWRGHYIRRAAKTINDLADQDHGDVPDTNSTNLR